MTTAHAHRRRRATWPAHTHSLLTAVACAVFGVLGTGCAPTEADASPCAPADRPLSDYLEDRSQPPWATSWVESTMSSGATVSSQSGAATDNELIAMTIACAGLPENNPSVALLPDESTEVTIGTRPYLYAARGLRTADGAFIVGVAIERTGEGTVRFGVRPTEILGDLPTAPPPATAMVQWLRDDQVL